MSEQKRSRLFRITEKKLAVVMSSIFLVSLIPVLALSFFSYPAMDDFMFGAPAAAAAGDGFFAAVRAALSATAGYYDSWQGTFTAIPLFCLQPGIWGTRLYAVTTWIMLFALIAGTCRLCSVLLRGYCHAGKPAWLITAACILIPVIQFFPSVYEALYWFNGSVYYLCFQAFMLLWLSDTLLFIKDGKIGHLIPASVYCFLISGGNYVTALLAMELSVILLFVVFRTGKKNGWFLLFPFAILCTGFAFNAAAPGNAMRSAVDFSLSKACSSVLSSIGEAGQSFGEYTSIYVLLLCLILIPVFLKIQRTMDFRFPYPILVLAVAFLLYASSFTPTAFALGLAAGPHRLQNMRYWLFVLILAFSLFYVTGWFSTKLKEEGLLVPVSGLLSKLWERYGFVALVAVFALFSVCLCLSPKRGETATLGAVKSLVSGEASAWRRENALREQLLTSDETDVLLPPHQVRPLLLTSYDENGNTNDTWSVNKMAMYYGKNSVKIQ